MLRKIDGRLEGPFPSYHDYYGRKGRLARLIMPVTKWRRAVHVEAFMHSGERHLDIGYGDGFFLKRSKCRECWGLDLIYGDRFDGMLSFEDNFTTPKAKGEWLMHLYVGK